ncbi:hypothetical protein D3C84_914850 [compost metagenome]
MVSITGRAQRFQSERYRGSISLHIPNDDADARPALLLQTFLHQTLLGRREHTLAQPLLQAGITHSPTGRILDAETLEHFLASQAHGVAAQIGMAAIHLLVEGAKILLLATEHMRAASRSSMSQSSKAVRPVSNSPTSASMLRGCAQVFTGM